MRLLSAKASHTHHDRIPISPQKEKCSQLRTKEQSNIVSCSPCSNTDVTSEQAGVAEQRQAPGSYTCKASPAQPWTKLEYQRMHVRRGIRDANPRPKSPGGFRRLQEASTFRIPLFSIYLCLIYGRRRSWVPDRMF